MKPHQSSFRIAILLSAIIFAWVSGPALGATDVTINWNDVRQTITGFGASTAWGGGGGGIFGIQESDRPKIMDLLFDSISGIGLTMVRHQQPYDCLDASGNWRWDTDLDEVYMCQEAQKRGVRMFWTAPWTPPPMWKQFNDPSGQGGPLQRDHYQDYANYQSRIIREYKTRFGIDFMGVSVQNEPHFGPTWDGCPYTPEDLRDYIRDFLGPTLARDNVRATIIAPESNFFQPQWADVFMADPNAAKYVGIVAFHVYEGAPQPYPKAAAAGKELWETETSLMGGVDDSWPLAITFADQLHHCLTYEEVNAWHYWWLLSNTREGLIRKAGNTYVIPKLYYYVGHYTKFIRPGWKRITCTPPEFQGNNGRCLLSAFKDPASGKFAIVVANIGIGNPGPTINFRLNGFAPGTVTPIRTIGEDDKNVIMRTEAAIPVTSGAFSFTIENVSIATILGQGTPTTIISPPKQREQANFSAAFVDHGLRLHMPGPLAGKAVLAAVDGKIIAEWPVKAMADQVLPIPGLLKQQLYILRMEFPAETVTCGMVHG